MAKTGGAVQKLAEKTKRNGVRFKMGSFKPLLGRTKSAFSDKQVSLADHKRAIFGVISRRTGEWLQLPRMIGPVETFKGDGLPDDSLATAKAPKTMQERALEDKRNPLKGEMVEGWKPRPFGRRHRSGCYLNR